MTNLEVIISNLRHENEELGKALTYYHKHEAVIFKVRRKLGEAFNKKFPKGSLKRKKLSYMKEYVFHPVPFPEAVYVRRRQKLKRRRFLHRFGVPGTWKTAFPEGGEPQVSIVIPVYNQIHYTYACLVSILEHTKDVTYEVIIADDVSTDATEHLSRYAEGLVICRNSTNQGFLRNWQPGGESSPREICDVLK